MLRGRSDVNYQDHPEIGGDAKDALIQKALALVAKKDSLRSACRKVRWTPPSSPCAERTRSFILDTLRGGAARPWRMGPVGPRGPVTVTGEERVCHMGTVY